MFYDNQLLVFSKILYVLLVKIKAQKLQKYCQREYLKNIKRIINDIRKEKNNIEGTSRKDKATQPKAHGKMFKN
jgi:hypothetical protein